MEKLLTVSVAAYNVEKYLEETLESFADDFFNNKVEVFVIDDGGKDSSLTIAQNYAQRFPEIFIPVHKENGGWGSTVNYGIEHASGKYFKLLDGDDFFDIDALKSFILFLENNDSDVIFTPLNFVEDGTNSVVNTITYPEKYSSGNTFTVEEMENDFPLYMHGMTIKTDLLKNNNVKIDEHCFYTDIEYVFFSFVHIENCSVSNNNVYQYRVARQGQSVSIEGYKKHYLEHLRVTKCILEKYNSVILSSKKDILLKKMVEYVIGAQYRIFFLLKANKENKNMLIDFNNYLKSINLKMYNSVPLYIKILRITNFSPYRLLVFLRYLIHKINNLRKGK